ncbi:SDR family NAD(P)-dependent oxidoreductase [Dyadobacter luteus]|uniref:SDR family NAD(P)-dependent oxidoreductase n=1 Tax=Dyadobacter luteus TaxID=2259619 RepID=A0A3D8Y5Y5_9BACT|nr:SDR family oxidoreductase [Dyadobacter luteus]REA58031.1 SDR family NAD(P)-dependent oxidoreductase [Dyadobacter luteus]
MSKILVTGASGFLGKAVVNELLQKVDVTTISVLVRDPVKVEDLKGKGVNVIQADYNNYTSLESAFASVDKLYFVSSSDVANRMPQHEHVVKAAVQAGVGHIIYTSAQRKSEDGTSPIAFVGDAHWKTDELIKASGLKYTILKHGLYSDILPMFMGDQVVAAGTIFLPAADGKTSFVSRQDLAVAGANILATDGHDHKIYEFGGPVSYSFAEIAGILSQLSGKTIQYVSPSVDEFTTQLKSYGLPDEAIQGAATFCSAIAQGEFNFPSTNLQTILGRDPESVEGFLKVAYQL